MGWKAPSLIPLRERLGGAAAGLRRLAADVDEQNARRIDGMRRCVGATSLPQSSRLEAAAGDPKPLTLEPGHCATKERS